MNKLNYMFPSLQVNYFRYCFPANSVSICNGFVPNAGRCLFSYFTNICIHEFCRLLLATRSFIQVIFKCMDAILSGRHPIKIGNAIVIFISVNMVNLWEIFCVWYKSVSNKTMHKMFFAFSVFRKQDVNIAKFCFPMLKNDPVYSLFRSPSIDAKAIKRSRYAGIRNFVLSNIVFNRNPFFINHFNLLFFKGLDCTIDNKVLI